MSPSYQIRRVPVRTILLISGALAGCSQWTRVGEVQRSSPEVEISQLFDPNTLYTRLGRLVSPDQVHYVGSVAFVPGHGDNWFHQLIVQNFFQPGCPDVSSAFNIL